MQGAKGAFDSAKACFCEAKADGGTHPASNAAAVMTATACSPRPLPRWEGWTNRRFISQTVGDSRRRATHATASAPAEVDPATHEHTIRSRGVGYDAPKWMCYTSTDLGVMSRTACLLCLGRSICVTHSNGQASRCAGVRIRLTHARHLLSMDDNCEKTHPGIARISSSNDCMARRSTPATSSIMSAYLTGWWGKGRGERRGEGGRVQWEVVSHGCPPTQRAHTSPLQTPAPVPHTCLQSAMNYKCGNTVRQIARPLWTLPPALVQVPRFLSVATYATHSPRTASSCHSVSGVSTPVETNAVEAVDGSALPPATTSTVM